MLKNTSVRYGGMQKFLHWLMAVLIIGMLIFGYTLDDFSYAGVYNLHKLIGLLVLALILWRILWLCWCKRPALPKTVPKGERILAYTIEALLYLSMLFMPLFGWLATSFAGRAPVFFGYVLQAPFTSMNDNAAHDLMQMHKTVAVIFIVLIVLHVLGALKHYFLDHDGVLERMLPWRSKSQK